MEECWCPNSGICLRAIEAMSILVPNFIQTLARKIREICRSRSSAASDLSVCAEADCLLDIHPTARVSGRIRVSQHSELKVGANCVLREVDIALTHGAHLEIEEGAILDYSTCMLPASIRMDDGWLRIGENANLKCSMGVRFGGRMEIGAHTGISSGAEIRCEESVTIGRYCLISYEVCIYDTNTHSLDWRERRERIEQGYPHGASEIRRPLTRPVLIGDDVWIGKRAMITKGTTLGDRTLVGMGTIVGGKLIPPDSKVVSMSVRVISNVSDPETMEIDHD